MYKDKTKQKTATKERVRRYRAKGVTAPVEGVTLATEGVTLGVTPDIIDKLTDKFWRGRLEKICSSFQNSHHPDYIHDVWLGDYNLADVCGMLECTS